MKSSFSLNTEQGELIIYYPHKHIFVEGNLCSEKSQFIIKPIIKQAVEKGYAGVVYDIGNGNSYGSLLYSALKQAKEKDDTINTNFSFINFKDMSRTVRVNPLSKRYISSVNDLSDIITNLFYNFNFISHNNSNLNRAGFHYLLSIAWNLFKNYSEYATIPHVMAIASLDFEKVRFWCRKDKDVSDIIDRIPNNIVGIETILSYQIPSCSDPNIFWVMSKDEFNLDITDTNNPFLLCIEDNNKIISQESSSPYTSAIFSILMKNMNQYDKTKSIFCIDDFCTSFKLYGIDIFVATVRPKRCSTIIGVDLNDTLIENYGVSDTWQFQTNFENMFFGSTHSVKTSDFVTHLAFTFDKKISQRDVFAQMEGEFIGKISGLSNPFFQTQFAEFKYQEEPIPYFATNGCKIGDDKTDKMVLDNLIKDNYERIINEAKELLEPYRMIPE